MQAIITRRSLFKFFSLALTIGVFLVFGSSVSQSFDDWGEFDGAIWRVHLTPKETGRGPKADKAVPLTGHFRVEKKVLYQSDGKRDKEKSRKIGTSRPDKQHKKLHTVVEFTDLVVHNRELKVHTKISGKATLFKVDKEQAGKGLFVEEGDGKGWRWDMEITRVKE